MVNAWLPSYFEREVVPERELHLEPVVTETIGKILAAAPLQLGADHRVRHGGVKQVAERIMAGAERVGRLGVGVVDVLRRISHRAGEPVGPGVVKERNDSNDGQWF